MWAKHYRHIVAMAVSKTVNPAGVEIFTFDDQSSIAIWPNNNRRVHLPNGWDVTNDLHKAAGEAIAKEMLDGKV
jgi:hypothetical protein